MARVWLMWVIVPLVVLLAGVLGWLVGLRYASSSNQEAGAEIREKYSALLKISAMKLAVGEYGRCAKRVDTLRESAAREKRRTGRLGGQWEAADRIQKEQCEAIKAASGQSVQDFKNEEYAKRYVEEWRTIHYELQKGLIAVGRFAERNQIASEGILWDTWERLDEINERLERIEQLTLYR